MIKRFIFIFIILDFISTIRMSGYYFEEGIISIFQYYFFKSNLYPVLFLIILTFRNATHRYYNNIILTFVSMISILNLTFLIKYFLVFGNFVGFAKYFELQLFSGRNILAMVSLFCIIIVTEKFIKQNKKFLFQILMFLSIGINIAIITFLFSRQTYLLFILYLVISIIVNSRARIKTLITIILFSFSFFVFFNTFNIEIVSRVAASFGMTSTELLTFGYKSGSLLDDSSINQRIMFYKMQVPYFFDNPHHFLIGGGKEYIRTIAYKYGATESSKSGKGMHSTYVKILDNIGISGLVVYFSLLYHIYAKISFNKKVNKYFIIFFIIILLSYFFHERHLFLYSPLSLLCWLVFAEQLNTTSLKKS